MCTYICVYMYIRTHASARRARQRDGQTAARHPIVMANSYPHQKRSGWRENGNHCACTVQAVVVSGFGYMDLNINFENTYIYMYISIYIHVYIRIIV